MPRIGRTTVGTALLAGLVAGCASVPEQIDGVCRHVGKQVDALAPIADTDSSEHIVPLLDTQLGIARQGHTDLAGITPDEVGRPAHDVLLRRWDALVATMQRLRDTWQDPSRGRPRYLGDDMVLPLNISADTAGLRQATERLAASAGPVGAPSCSTIPWRGRY